MVNVQQIFITLFLAAAALVGSAPTPNNIIIRDLIERDPVDWGNYVYISSITSGIVGQNLALIATPGNRAACPGEVADLQGCAGSFESECMEERFGFEWCLQHRITPETCGSEWINMTLGCMGHSAAYCVETLFTLNDCANLVEVPEVPPP